MNRRLIDVDAFVTEYRKIYCENCKRRQNSKGKFVYEIGGVPCRACYIGDMIDDVDSAPTVCCETCKHGIKGECIGDCEYVSCTKPYAEISNSHTKDWFCGDWRDKDDPSD